MATAPPGFPVGLTAISVSGNRSFPGESSTCDLFEGLPRSGSTPAYVLASAASGAHLATDPRDELPASVGDDFAISVDSARRTAARP